MALCSCGSDESNDAQGFYGNKGKKLVRMAKFESGVEGKYYYSNSPKYELSSIYTINYDNEGKLTSICLNDYETSKKIFEIDYGLMLIKSNQVYLPFTINEKGFVTQFSYYTFQYDQGGFLKNIIKDRNYQRMWSFAYQDNDLLYFIENISGTQFHDNYSHHCDCYYEDDINTGETHYYLEQKEYYTHSDGHSEEVLWPNPIDYNNEIQDICIILYQAGFFGRITKHFKSTINTDNKPVIVSPKESDWVFHHESLYRNILQLKYTFVYE